MSQIKRSPLDHMVEAYQEELEYQVDNPPAHDPRIAAFSIGMLDTLEHDDEALDILEDVFSARLERGRDASSYLANITLRACQRALYLDFEREPSARYPLEYDETKYWKADLPILMRNEKGFQHDVSNREVQSNVSDRYVAFRMLMHLYKDRFGDEPSILDVGCSLNLGLHRIEGDYGFYIPEAVELNDVGQEQQMPERMQSNMAAILDAPQGIGRSLGIDIEPTLSKQDTLDIKRWVFSCSFYPTELMDNFQVSRFHFLALHKPVNIRFQQQDFTKDEPDLPLPPGKTGYDMVTFSTMLYQASSEERKRMIANAKKYVNENGIIVVQDFVKIDSDDPHELVFPDNWFKEAYGYRTLVLDMRNEEAGFEEVFRWKSGRCHRVAPNLGASCLQNFTS